ncbi:hypothetical protein Pst134EA_015484 [Puccinia striiformis f. sp. tritici]|uniref:hypothetical protein n=1 Tax=Puccinia striiformis f. sp. tritici TaxID=168172 RepID=UPI00200843F1|nr:hypothetical protein Pst134EA_015484 [Puccinia striiformis f. sp. tritici]KAH9452653.1 hypothetical protein Pst134EB_016605 [Puccinia striiformis f. sp. tritici]KAH9463401.1 hypothetical protein Pst134EA_015484 [Puccinia striiformis f. sp. tritici]
MNQNEFRDCFGKRKGTAKLARVLSRLRSVRGNNESVRQGLQDEKTGSLDSGMTTLPPSNNHHCRWTPRDRVSRRKASHETKVDFPRWNIVSKWISCCSSPPEDFHGSGIERGADSASITMS